MTAQEYYDNIPEDRHKDLLKLRKMILSHPAGFKETMDYNLPSYVHGDKVAFAIANQKGHIGFYVCERDLKKEFKSVFEKYNCGKSCVRLKRVDAESLTDLKNVIDSLV